MEDIEKQDNPTYKEKLIVPKNGCSSLVTSILLLIVAALTIPIAIIGEIWFLFALVPICVISAIIICCGMMTIEPNEAINCMFYGKYEGTVRENGFFFINPLYSKRKMSLKV